MTTFTMQEAVAASGLSPDAIRYYEDEGIIGPFERSSSNHRRFSDSDLAWIGVVTCMRDAGLGISDLREFATLLRGEEASADPATFLRERRAALDARAEALQRAIDVLDDKITHFGRRHEQASPETHRP
ncbi:MerR family transcriptional regulator [Arthrobacter sp. RCC_34]|uniref:MerR family transcriptional regulator n=1 Tax=Arthrobacter sp. RCC_34 TaxID=3239230 RepID=UPI00352372D3